MRMGKMGMGMRMAVMMIVIVAVIVIMMMIVVAVIVCVASVGANPFNMMVVAFLRPSDLGLEAQNLRAVFAELAVHLVLAREDFLHALDKNIKDERVAVEVSGLQEFDLRMAGRHRVGDTVDSFDQDAGEKKIRKNDDTLITKAHGMFETGAHQRKRDAAITDFHPAKAHAFPQHPRNLGDIAVGVGIGGAAPDDDKQRIRTRDPAGGGLLRRLDPFSRDFQKFWINGKIAPVLDGAIPMLRLIGIENRRDVVLGVTGGKKHPGDGEDAIDALRAQLVEAFADHRPREFEKAESGRIVGKPSGYPLRQRLELADRCIVAAAVAANHNPNLIRHNLVHTTLSCHFLPPWRLVAYYLVHTHARPLS